MFFLLFSYTLSLSFLHPLFFPHLPLLIFAPFLIRCFYLQNKINCLWIALLCGLTIDLFASQTRLGFYAMTYVLTVASLYNYKYYFFEDNLSTLPILTGFFTILSTLFQLILLYLIGQGLVLSWQWVKNDLVWMPLYDALYAFCAFSLPILFIHKRSRIRI